MSGKQQKVLIIDDSILIVKVLSQILEDEFEVITASSGEKGLRLALEEMPDLILLDVVMGTMDGYEVCKLIKANIATQNIPVIFISGLDNINDEKKGLEAGAIDYIIKPFSEPIVKIRVKNHLELKRHRDMLAELSSIDGLTGIYNRRYFDTYYNFAFSRAIKNQSPISLMILDIDYFKLYNDYYGHLAGDDCLRKIAETLNYTIDKKRGFVCRYGGEEFVCVMPETNLEDALKIAEKMHKNIEDLKIPHFSSEVSSFVTISSGLGTATPTSDMQPLQFVKDVDELLYVAKRTGRNRIKCSEMK